MCECPTFQSLTQLGARLLSIRPCPAARQFDQEEGVVMDRALCSEPAMSERDID